MLNKPVISLVVGLLLHNVSIIAVTSPMATEHDIYSHVQAKKVACSNKEGAHSNSGLE